MEDFDAILKRHRPRGYKIAPSKRRTEIALKAKDADVRNVRRKDLIDCAYVDFDRKIIRIPYVGCTYTLQIVLHEFAHVHLKHISYVGEPHDKNPLHIQEFEADRLSMEWMRMAGFTVTAAIKRSHKRYLRHVIAHDEGHGVAIKPHIRKRATKK